MDHLMNMGKKFFKNSANANNQNHYNEDYSNYNPNSGYNLGPNNVYSNYGPDYTQSNYGAPGYGPTAYTQPNYGAPGYGPTAYTQPNYGAPGYGPQGYSPQHFGNDFSMYGAPPATNFGYGSSIPTTNAQLYGSGQPAQGNQGHSMNILKAFDRDGDGQITENDFVIAARQIGLGFLGESIARNTFKRFDKNRNGKLEISEALGAIGTLKGMGGHKH